MAFFRNYGATARFTIKLWQNKFEQHQLNVETDYNINTEQISIKYKNIPQISLENITDAGNISVNTRHSSNWLIHSAIYNKFRMTQLVIRGHEVTTLADDTGHVVKRERYFKMAAQLSENCPTWRQQFCYSLDKSW